MNLEEIACCVPMLHALQDEDFEYNPIYKYIVGFIVEKKSQDFGRRVLRYCPFCGEKQPNLLLVYEDALEEALGKDFCDITEDEIPEEFKTDEWWKKRGL